MGAVDVLNPVELVKGLGRLEGHRPLRQVCAPLGWGWRGSLFAQETAHPEKRGDWATLRRASASEVSYICRLHRVAARRVR